MNFIHKSHKAYSQMKQLRLAKGFSLINHRIAPKPISTLASLDKSENSDWNLFRHSVTFEPENFGLLSIKM